MKENFDPNYEHLSPEAIADAEEAKRFMRERGLVSTTEQMNQLIRVLSVAEHQRFLRLAETMNLLETKLRSLPEVQRMKQLQQLAGKVNPRETARKNQYGVEMTLPPFHSRYHHSEAFAQLAKIAALKAGVSDEGVMTLLSAAWLHDTGHSAFSHIGETLLKGQGYPDHEARSESVTMKQASAILEEFGVQPQQVVATIQEQGALGQIQSALDTLSYMMLDSAQLGRPVYRDRGVSTLESIRGLNYERGLLEVSNVVPWQELLDKRAQHFQDVIYSPTNKLLEAAKAKLLKIAIDAGYIQVSEMFSGGDDILQKRLQSLVQLDPGASMLGGRQDAYPHLTKFKALFECSGGFFPDNWDYRRYDSLEEVNSFLSRLRAEQIELSVVVEPFDYTKKELRLLVHDEDGSEQETTLRSSIHLTEEDTKYYVYYPKSEKTQ